MFSKLKSTFTRSRSETLPVPEYEVIQVEKVTESVGNNGPMVVMPDDIIRHILHYFNFAQRTRLRQVCQHWKFTIDHIKDLGIIDQRFLNCDSHDGFEILVNQIADGKYITGLKLSRLQESKAIYLENLISVILNGKHKDKFKYFQHFWQPPLNVLKAIHLKYLSCQFGNFDQKPMDIGSLGFLETLIGSGKVENLKSNLKILELNGIDSSSMVSTLDLLKSCPPSLEVLGLYGGSINTLTSTSMKTEACLAFPRLRSLSMRFYGNQLPVQFDLTASTCLESLHLDLVGMDPDYAFMDKMSRGQAYYNGNRTYQIIDDFGACCFNEFCNLRCIKILLKGPYPKLTSGHSLPAMVANNVLEELVIQVSLDPSVVSQLLSGLAKTGHKLQKLELRNSGFLDSAMDSENALKILAGADMNKMDLLDVIVEGEHFVPLVPKLHHSLTHIRVGGVRMNEGENHYCEKLSQQLKTVKPRTKKNMLELQCNCGGDSVESCFCHNISKCEWCRKLNDFGFSMRCYRYKR